MGSGAGATFEARRIALAAASPVQSALDACVEELGFIRAPVSAAVAAAAAAAAAPAATAPAAAAAAAAAAGEREERGEDGESKGKGKGKRKKRKREGEGDRKNAWTELFSLLPRVASAIRGGVGLTT